MEVTVISQINRHFFAPLLPVEDGDSQSVSFGLIKNGVACGCAQFTIQGQQATLVHILVAPGYRRCGGGTHLLQESGNQFRRLGLTQIVCTPTYLPWDANSYLGLFLTACGFAEGAPCAWVYTAPLFSFSHSFSSVGPSKHIVPLQTFPKNQWPALTQGMKKSPSKQALDAILVHPDLHPICSMVSIEAQTLTGYLMLLQPESLSLEVAGLTYLGADKGMLLKLLSATVNCTAQHCPPETMVTTLVNNPKMAHLLDRALSTACHSKCPVHHFTLL